MTTAPRKMCGQAGCQLLAAIGQRYCTRHTTQTATDQRSYDKNRSADPFRQLYRTRRWRDHVQPAVLRRDPVCRDPFALGCYNLSTQADHVIPAKLYAADDMNKFFDLDNLQGLCDGCHGRKTRSEGTDRPRGA